MCLSLLPVCEIKKIAFGQSAIRHHILQWALERNRKISDGYDFEKTRTPAKREKASSSSDLKDFSQSMIAVTDTSLPESTETADTVEDISNYSAQLVCAVIFRVPTFRNLSVKKHLAPAAKLLKIKTRGQGKYDLAVNVAIGLVQKGYVGTTNPDVNYKELEREQIVILKDLEEELHVENIKKQEALSSSPSENEGD
ncbi:hypothetical protein pdam_00011721 [Pocillopora damicornis]|uniref:Uncharacterized protein n=1 Tax=Pocillopora damicornis TaxID=46731 RepID=A0A3M6T7S9_POCDA|nr:hypothetical protein pdam_00011721 [Pocillopora damicornis]